MEDDNSQIGSDEPVVDGEPESDEQPEPAGLFASWLGSRSRLIALLVGVAFLIVVISIAISDVSEERRGAESAAAAVEELVEALSNEDIVAALNVMAPSEVGTLGDMYPRLVELAVEGGAVKNENWLAGVDFEMVGLETRAKELHPGVALVELRSGTLSASIDPDVADTTFFDVGGLEGADLETSVTIEEMREAMRELETSTELDESREAVEEMFGTSVGERFTVRAPRDGVFLMTVERGGRWYVSPFYTVAEFARQILDLPPADFALSREQAMPGASSPAGVVDDVVEVINSYTIEQHLETLLEGDPRGVFDPFAVFVPYDELGVFIDYSPSFAALTEEFNELLQSEETQDLAAELEELIDSLEVEGQVSVTVDVREKERPDGDVVLYLESGSISLDISALLDPDSDDVTEAELDLSWDGLCVDVSGMIDGEPQESFDDCVPAEDRPEGLDEIFVVVGEIDGSWYVSYVETFLAYMDIVIADQLRN